MEKKIIGLAAFLLICGLAVAQSGSGNTGSSMFSANQAITNGPVAEYVADSSAVIGWSAQESSSNMSIRYGSDRDQMNQTAQAAPGSDAHNFHARLRGLTPNTRYYFQVMQKNQAVGGVGTFQTVATGESPIESKATIPK
jgi:phosphodiesterase/alkaline phosphatase D-like protein